MLNKFIELCTTEKIFPVQKIIVAVSGGADSLALADLLNRSRQKFKLEICIAHFEHGLRGQDSVDDAIFVENFAKSCFFVKAATFKNFLRKIKFR